MNYCNKVKIYFYSSLVLSAIVTVLYVICSLIAFDAHIGYFSTYSPLPFIAKYLMAFNIIWIVSMLLFIPAKKLSPSYPSYSALSRITSATVFAGFVFYGISRLISATNNQMAATPLFFMCLITAALSSLIFLFNVINPAVCNNRRSILTTPIILWATLSMTEAYSNQFVTMNSPFKIMLMMSMMSIMLFALYEARYLSGYPYPRAYAISVLVGICASSAFSVSFIVLSLTGAYSIYSFVPTAIVSFAFTVHQISRAFDYLKVQFTCHTEDETDSSPFETNE